MNNEKSFDIPAGTKRVSIWVDDGKHLVDLWIWDNKSIHLVAPYFKVGDNDADFMMELR